MTPVERDEGDGRFRSLLERALHGNQDAAWELLEHYGAHLVHLLIVKRHEQQGLPVDAVRLVSQAWALLRSEPQGRPRGGKPVPADRLDASPIPASPIPAPTIGPSGGDEATIGLASPEFPTLGQHGAAASQPTDDDQVDSARRRWKHLTVTPEQHGRILKLRLNGASFAEIAAELGLAELVVRRVIQSLARQSEDLP